MAKHIYTKPERRAQAIKSGIKLARKSGISKLTIAAVAADLKVSSPLISHVFGTKAEFVKAVRTEAKRQGVSLEQPVSRSTDNGKFVSKATAAAKPCTTVTGKRSTKRTSSRSAVDGKFVSKATAAAHPRTTVTNSAKFKPLPVPSGEHG